jgi:YVTN family beta-propeller protein
VVVNQRDSTVSLVDLRTGTARKTLKTGPGPHEAVAAPNGKRVAVSNYGPPVTPEHGNTLTLVALPKGEVERTIDLGDYRAPHGLAWLDDDRFLCTCEQNNAVVVVNAATGKVEREVKTGLETSHMVALAPDRKRAFTANVLPGTVSVLDLTAGKKLRDVEVGNGVEGLGISPDGKRVWVLNRKTSEAKVIDTEGLTVDKTLPTPQLPFRVAFTPDGSTALIACAAGGELVLYDAKTLKERKRVSFTEGKVKFDLPGPLAVTLRPDGKTAYATVLASDAVAVIDLEKGEVTGKIAVGHAPDGIAFSPIDLGP